MATNDPLGHRLIAERYLNEMEGNFSTVDMMELPVEVLALLAIAHAILAIR
jgi:hypothetical protein